MRTLPLTVLLFAAAILPATAQLVVEVVVDRDQFLRNESLPVKVRVTNRSGQPLRLGVDNEWLSFAVEGHDTGTVTKTAEVPVKGEFTLESSQVATRQVDLSPCYDLSQPGRYTITATVRIKEWNDETTSRPRRIEIVRGTKLWEQEFGVPTESGFPETRRFILQQANYQKQLKLYLRVTDLSDNKVFRVFPLGSLVSFSQPEAKLDRSSELNTLFQTGARSFLFYVIRPDGEIAIRQTYDYTTTRPTLRSNDEGRIFISGGVRRLTPNDIPTSIPGSAAVTPVPNPGTNAPTNNSATEQPKKNGKAPKK